MFIPTKWIESVFPANQKAAFLRILQIATRFLQVAQRLNVKNGLKVKQCAKQSPTLKMLLQKISVELRVIFFFFQF